MANMMPVVRRRDAKFLRAAAKKYGSLGHAEDAQELRKMARRIEKIANENAMAILTTSIKVTDLTKVRDPKAKRILTLINGKNMINALKLLDDHQDTKGTTIGELETIISDAVEAGAADVHY